MQGKMQEILQGLVEGSRAMLVTTNTNMLLICLLHLAMAKLGTAIQAL